MPTYKVNGKTYNIPEDKVTGFEAKYPYALVEYHDHDEGKMYRLPLYKREGFLRKHPHASLSPSPTDSTDPKTFGDNSDADGWDDKGLALEMQKVHNIASGFDYRSQAIGDKLRNIHKNFQKGGWIGGGTVTKGDFEFNPETKEVKQLFITPLGNKTTSKEVAERETMLFREANDLSITGRLRKANNRLKEVNNKLATIHSEVVQNEEPKQGSGLGSMLGRALQGAESPGGASHAVEAALAVNPEYKALQLAADQLREQITLLENAHKKEIEGEEFSDFWHIAGEQMDNVKDWDFNISNLLYADTKLRINHKLRNGEQLNTAEQQAMSEIAELEEIQQNHGDLGTWARWGEVGGAMIPFMMDIGIGTIGFSGINFLSKGASKMATNVVGKEAVEAIAEQGVKQYIKANGWKGLGRVASDWSIKALGTGADELLIQAPLAVNTVQFGKTASDIIDRKLGNVKVEEGGTYSFSNDKTWGDAAWQGEANAIIEYYSEQLGSHLPSLSAKGLSSVADVVGAKRLSNLFLRVDASALTGMVKKLNDVYAKLGVNGVIGEVMEEYAGQGMRTAANLDDAYQPLFDEQGNPVYKKDEEGNLILDENGEPIQEGTNLFATGQFHGDIWGGMGLTMGLMKGVNLSFSAAGYTSAKHSMNKASKRASILFGKRPISTLADTDGVNPWVSLRDMIDMTTNEDMGALAETIMSDKDMNYSEKSAVMDYIAKSLEFRGFNLGSLAQSRMMNEVRQGAKSGEMYGNLTSTADRRGGWLNQSWHDGYSTTDAEGMEDIMHLYQYREEQLFDKLGTDKARAVLSDPESALHNGIDIEENEAITNYVIAWAVYSGMRQRIQNDIETAVEEHHALIDLRTHKDTGAIQRATMKQDARPVYIIKGNVVPLPSGGIDIEASDDSIVVIDAVSGDTEMVSATALLNAYNPVNSEDEKSRSREYIEERENAWANNKMGVINDFSIGQEYNILNVDGGIQRVTIVDPVDANGKPIENEDIVMVSTGDGSESFSISKSELAMQSYAAGRSRMLSRLELEQGERDTIDSVITDRAANRPQYAFNDKVTLRNDEGNIIHGQIAEHNEADDTFVLDVDSPIGGKYVPMLTRAELESMIMEHNGTAVKPIKEATPTETEDGNNGAENIISPTVDELNVPTDRQVSEQQPSAFERVPKDMQGNPLYEQTDSDTAWDAIVEQTEGDEAMAQTVADGMVADKEAALKKLEKAKSKGGVTIAEKIAAEKERKAAIDAAQEELNIWKKIAGTANRRKMEADAERRRVAEEAAALRKAEEERLRAEREEAERIEREALNGVPDMVDDTPQDARARGYRRVSGHKIDRQEPVQGLQGKDVAVRFSDDAIANGRVAVIEANQLQPSHVQGQRNPLHFIDEAQPKERNDEASVLSARKIAGNIRPEEITSSVTAYTGAPTVNARGEAIQGNNRSDALRQMWEGYQDQAAKYKQYLIDHAEEFGLNADEVAAMQQPVLVNILDVEDADAITLGQYVAQDTESGGTERIKPKNALQKMGNDMRSFANLLLKSNDEETSFAGLVDANGVEVLKWMSGRGYITPTQYKSAFDSKGNLTAEAKNDLRGIMYQSIFKSGSTRLEEMFNAMPAKAQKAILATAFRDYDSPNAERMIEEIQKSIRAFYALSQSEDFVNAKTFKDARIAVESWKIQYQIDDVTGESYLPAENFSNFALLLATMYKGENQSIIQGTFNKLYDLIQGTQEPNLFEQPDNTPRTLAQAIYETLNITYDGQQRSNVLVGDSSASQRGQQGSTGNAATGERVENGERTADSAGSIDGDSRGIRIEQENRGNQGEETHIPQTEEVIGRSLSANEAENFIADMEENADTAPDIELTIENWDALFGEEGTVATPIGEVKMGESQFTKLMRADRNGKLGMIKPTLENPHAIVEDTSEAKGDNVTERASSYVFIRSFKKADGSRYYYFTSVTVSKDGKEVVISNQEKSKKRIFNLLQNGVISWINKNVQSVSEAQSEESVLLDDSQAATQADNNTASLGINSSELSEGKDTTISPITNELGEKSVVPSIQEQVQAAEAEVNTNPTDKQKEAGNYKKGHVQIRFARTASARQRTSELGNSPSLTRGFGTFNVTIEQPKGSVRSGIDANGNKWETEMKNTYGYIRGTEGVDGDHIDVFLSDDIDGWNGRQVFVVDQYNEDGSFDEHKVMLGFNDIDEADAAYLSNYAKDWANKRKIVIRPANIEDFEKWIASSHRKTKAFAEYKSVQVAEKRANNSLSEIKSRIEDLHKEQEAAHNRSDIFEEARIIAEMNELYAEQRRLEQVISNKATATPTISQDSKQVSDQDSNAASLIDVVRTLYTKGKDVASKLFQRSFFDVAQTPKFMKELGLHGDKFTIKYGVIARHLGKDSSHTLTEKDWEQLPQALQNPFAISKLTDKNDSYRIYTTLQTEGGEFVVVGADVKNAGREIEVNAISTVFGRRNNANLPKNEEVIYRSKEITPEQSSLLERPNFAQYPTEQELSEDKGTTNSPTTKELDEKNVDMDRTGDAVYSIIPAQYTTKKGKMLDMHLVKFAGTLTKEQQRAAKELAKADKGWYDREQGGFMMRSEESAKQLADTILNNDDAVSDAQPREQYEDYAEKMKKELEEKEAKYAEMDADADVEVADNLSNTEEDDDTLYRSDDTIKNRIEALFNQAISGEFKGKPISIGRLTDAGKVYLEQISGIAFRENVDFVLNPSDLMHIYKDHFGNNEKDKGQNIPLDIEYIRSLADVISSPDKVIFFKEGEGLNRNMFYFFKEAEDGTYNLMEIYSDKKGNLTAKTFYKTRKGSNQRVIDIEKSLLRTSETSLAHPLSGANIPQMFESTSIEDDFSARDGVGAYTDDEVSFENDPIFKVLGKSRFTRKQRREFAERERLVERVESLAKKLHLDNVEVVSQLEGKKQRAKGFYSKSTGKITIVIPNHSSTFDVEQTLLHEAVAHYGLRQLFGEHFDTFLDNVFNNADEAIRKRIVALASKNGWDFRKATEEYLAMLAENTEFENTSASWWRQIKDFFLNMLHKIGFKDLTGSNHLTLDQTSELDGSRSTDGFRGVTLTDNELRYILWRSYENLAEPGKYRSILGEAADVAKQYELKVGNYAPVVESESRVAERTMINDANERFNKQLEELTEKNAQSVILNLGYPSSLLIGAGISNRQIRLYGNKVVKKMKKHGFTLSDIKNLPLSINNPIAVFNNYETEGNRAILTELHTPQGNILVTISWGKGSDAELNIISSVFGKGQKNIIGWINNGYATYINKEKALNYLRISTPIVKAQDNQELKSITKVIESFENPTIEDDVLFRSGEPEIHERELARERYERRVKSGMFQSQEALQDSMLGLKEAMQAILGHGKHIEDVDGFENAYLGENRLSSVNKAEADAFAQTLFKPMLDAVAKLARNEAEREELTDYMMAKHGLERNEYMRNQAEANGEDSDRDYAGLTALTGMDDVADAEAEAQRIVDDYEQAHDTTDLWEKVNAVSKAILQKSYDCGMMSKETFDKVSDMYEFYIPLRGFDEKTSAEAYAYLSHKHSAFNAPIKKAEGRRSKADDPFANLESMAEAAIMQGNRNKLVKQRFLNFALNHPSDLVSVSDLWLEYDAVTDEWKPVFPDNIDSTDTPEEVEKKMQDFETKMEALSQRDPNRYKHGKDAIGIPYRIVESRDMRQHQVVVKRGGRDYVITINGNPRAAQALNGQTNPDNDMSGAIGAILRAGEKINRQLSAFYTTRNPDFIVSNFVRDMLYTNTMAWIKESPNYALRFHRNYLMVNPVTMKRLLAKYRKGTLDMSDKTEAMFHQFMMNGGETGYANIRDIEQHKNDIKRELKRANGKLKIGKAWSLLAEKFDELNRAVENCARFAAFVTSREMGRSIDRAIYDAKEISVNFNKKGSGAKFYDSVGQTKAGNASALVSGLGRSGYVFWNAAIQGTTNFGRQMKRHPAKAFTGVAAMFLLGAIVAYLGGDDDEDDKNAYYNLPEYVRRSNILFRAGDSWISIPLPIEYRAFYGMGELMTSVFSGKEHLTGGEIAEAVLGQATQILPIDFLEGGGGLNAFVPSAAKPLWEAYVAEKSWTGMPLYKDTPFNKDMPEWTKAYSSTNKHIVNLAATLNEATGGDPYTKGAIDINPAKVEYMLNGYFGGVFGTIDKLTKTADILLVNRLVKAGDERTEYRAVNNEYFRLKEEHDRLKTRLRHYEEDTDNGIFDYAEKIDFLYNSPEYERYEIFEDYRRDIDDLYDELKEAVDDEERKYIEAELNEVKKEMIQEMNLTRKRK